MRIGRWGTLAALVCLPATGHASDCTVAHQAAADHYAAFVSSSRQQQALENWETLARQFEAVAEKSRNKLLQAVLLDPTVDSYRRAVAMVDELLRLEADALPELK